MDIGESYVRLEERHVHLVLAVNVFVYAATLAAGGFLAWLVLHFYALSLLAVGAVAGVGALEVASWVLDSPHLSRPMQRWQGVVAFAIGALLAISVLALR